MLNGKIRRYLAGLTAVLAFGGINLVLAPEVKAQGDTAHSLSANVAFTNDYVFRAVTQSSEEFAVQGGFDYEHISGLSFGVWGSSINFGGVGESTELDIYGGYSGAVGDFSYGISGIYYSYPGVSGRLNFDFFEVAVSAEHPIGPATVSISANFSPDYFGGSGDAVYYAAGVSVPLGDVFALDLHLGHQDVSDNASFALPDYTDWSAGISASVLGFDAGLSYIDTDISDAAGAADLADSRVVFVISRSF